MSDIHEAVRRMTQVKNYLRDMARGQMLGCASDRQKERGRKLYSASKALEEMLDEIAVYGWQQEGADE